MRTSTSVIDNYFGLLAGLSRENKIKLVAKLSNDIAKEVSMKSDIVDTFFGAFKSDKDTDTLIKEIRDSRVFSRTVEAL